MRYVRMVKSGSTSITHWLKGVDNPQGHAPAHRVARKHEGTWGTVRHPGAWYRSWYRHMARTNSPRIKQIFHRWGDGDQSFRGVLYGLTHPESGRRPGNEATRFQDHLYNPCGHFLDPASDQCRDVWGDEIPGMWTRSIVWFFGTVFGQGWEVSDLVDLRYAEEYLQNLHPVFDDKPLEHRNKHDDAVTIEIEDYDDEMISWVLGADGEMIEKIRRDFGVELEEPWR